MEMSNYDITREQAKKIFLQYDQKEIIRKWKLSYDASYLYVKFVNRDYRIDREIGTIEWSKDDFTSTIEADFNVTSANVVPNTTFNDLSLGIRYVK